MATGGLSTHTGSTRPIEGLRTGLTLAVWPGNTAQIGERIGAATRRFGAVGEPNILIGWGPSAGACRSRA